MNPRFRLLPEQASTFAEAVDPLLIFLTAVSAAVTLLIFVMVVYIAIKYRRRHPDETPRPTIESKALELAWTVIPFVVAMVMFFWGARVYFMAFKEVPDALDIHVIGKQWMWKVQHPDGTREINELHVPLGQRVQVTLASQDVVHSFYIPAFRVKQDAVPGRYTKMFFEATKVGTYRLFCAEYCGTQHSGMIGWVTVMEPEKYQEWLAGTVSGEPPAESGAKLFRQYGCMTCHGVTAPSLAGLYGTEREVVLPSGRRDRVKVDEAYLRESILDSGAKVVPGFEPIMPSFRGQMSEEQIIQLISFIKSIRNVADKTPLTPGPSERTIKD
jgi:cytochrome c oxidase subunit 2